MQAIIMAGGEGSRLRPLTCDIPKPMTRLCGRPVLEYILDLLNEHGVRDAAVTMQYLPQVITANLEEHYKGVRLRFVEEETPLGTAGCVRFAAGGAAENQEEILVISGDALTTVDLTAAQAFHRQSGAAVTLVVTHVQDPREYGLVEYGPDGRITGFLEKPGWAQVVTDAANTGIYILSPEVLDHIPAGKPFDFAKDLFPQLLRDGMPLYAYETDAYWCDIGDLHSYVTCQRDILEGKVIGDIAPDGLLLKGSKPAGNYVLIPPVYIGEGVQIGDASQIGPFAVLDDGCRVGCNARIRESVLLESAYVGNGASMTGALLCHSASVRKGASVFEGAVIGEGGVVGDHATVLPEVKIWPGKTVEDNSAQKDNLRDGGHQPSLLDDNGFSGETGVELTPEFCARLGAAVGSLTKGGKVAVGCSHDKAAAVLKMALISGILSVGGGVWDFSACIPPQFDYFVNFSRIPTGVYLSGGAKGCIRLLAEGGLPATRSMERSVESKLSTGDFSRVGWEDMQEAVNMADMRQLYRQELIGMAPDGLSGMHAEVRGADYETVRMLSFVLSILGCGEAGGIRFHLGAEGRRLSIFDPEAGYIWPEKVTAALCYMLLEDGKELSLPYDAPLAVEELAARYGREVHRYLHCPADGSDADARKLAAEQPWIRDGLMAAVYILSWLKKRRTTLAKVLEALPEFAVATKTIRCEGNPGRIIRELHAQAEEGPAEGTRIREKTGTVTVRPTKRGKSLVLTAEAADTEMAAELCGELEQRLQMVFLDIAGEKQ